VTIALSIAGSVVLLVAFALIERRTRNPLLPPRLLRLRSLVATDTAALTVLAAPFGVSFVVTLYLQDVLHRSPMQTALTLIPGSVLSALIGRYAAPRALDRFGLRPVYVAGMLIVAAGNSLLLGVDARQATWVVVTATLISFGLGMGLAYPAATVGGVQQVESDDHGTAAGLNNTALQIGGALGLAAVAAAVTAGLHGDAVGDVPAPTALHAIRLGALMATLLPLAGAVIAAIGLRVPQTSKDRRGLAR
jgi:Na+/melibiose symporter-like transporter